MPDGKDRILCSIDLGSSKIVTLIASAGESRRINLIGASSVLSKGIKKDQIVDFESATQAITESLDGAERMAGISISSAYVSIGGTHITSTNTHAVVAVAGKESDIDLKDLARFVTNDIAVGLKVSLESAEKIKQKLTYHKQEPTLNKDKKEDELDLKELGLSEETDKISVKYTKDTIMRARIREILELVKKEIKKSGFGGIVPFGVVMCGGGALTAGIVEQSKQVLGFSARIDKVEGFSGLSEEIDSPAFATASGLVLYGVEQSANSSPQKSFGLNMNILGLIKTWFSKLVQLIKSVFG